VLTQQEILEMLSKNLGSWKAQYGVIQIALFGSYTREEQDEASDIDLLVEFDKPAMTFDHYMGLKFTLEDLFEKPVDLVILDNLKPALKQDILRSAKYAMPWEKYY
jgi:predicted nucleotidyltransferase